MNAAIAQRTVSSNRAGSEFDLCRLLSDKLCPLRGLRTEIVLDTRKARLLIRRHDSSETVCVLRRHCSILCKLILVD